MIGSIYKVLRDFGYTYDKFDKEKRCYTKGNISIYIINRKDGGDYTYDCSVYISDEFYENTHTDEELSNMLKVLERDQKINEITKD